MQHTFLLQAIKEKERARDLTAASTHCESMAVELTAIASNVSSARKLLKSLDAHGTPFLDVLIDMEQKEVYESIKKIEIKFNKVINCWGKKDKEEAC